jgi:plastocyanin
MEFELFIKDNAFIPEVVDLKVHATVVFKNVDSVKHVIQCKGHSLFAPISLPIGATRKFTFEKHGKYLISEQGNESMKVCLLINIFFGKSSSFVICFLNLYSRYSA